MEKILLAMIGTEKPTQGAFLPKINCIRHAVASSQTRASEIQRLTSESGTNDCISG
jgi:hypothetical protein